jgi:hypothetical protein
MALFNKNQAATTYFVMFRDSLEIQELNHSIYILVATSRAVNDNALIGG